MGTVAVNIRLDEDTKRDMERVCKELGMSMTTAFSIFAKKVVRENRIPFDVSIDPFCSKPDTEHLKRSNRLLDEGCGVQHELLDFEDEKPTSKQPEPSSILAELDDLRAATPACPSLEGINPEMEHGSESFSNDCAVKYPGIWDSAPILETDEEGAPIAPDDWADDASPTTR